MRIFWPLEIAQEYVRSTLQLLVLVVVCMYIQERTGMPLVDSLRGPWSYNRAPNNVASRGSQGMFGVEISSFPRLAGP